METAQTAAEALVRLGEPFASKHVKWLVAATSRDGSRGRVTPYVISVSWSGPPSEVNFGPPGA